jgi:hypothetical protein
MRKGIKSLFSLLLVGVVLFSVYSSNQFGCAKALDLNSRGTITVYQQGAYVGCYTVCFYDENGGLISNPTKKLSAGFSKDFTIPGNACYLIIFVVPVFGVTYGCAYYAVNLESVSPYDKIECIGSGTVWGSNLKCASTEGWRLGQIGSN